MPQLPAISAALLALPLLTTAAEPAPDFNREIRPILATQCLACHGPDEEARKADLRLDTQSGSRADLGGYAAVVPGDPEASELIARVTTDDPDDLMPPEKHGPPLTSTERDLLRRWIDAGANYDTHWSFAPPSKKPLPSIRQQNWPTTPFDHFILARLEQENLAPSPTADRLRLIRRVSLDLTGLPPTPAEADAFANDTAPLHDALAKVVDRLLASETFGEHWARMWLDLARYADTKGYEKDRRRNIWRYRDWVIDALNRDMPYDQFTIEQLAGDLLPSPTLDQQLATAFHRNTMENEEGGTDDEEFRIAAVKDRVDTTMQVWMGLTMGCAKCHTHKYDPITNDDYYRFYAFFNQTEDADRAPPLLTTPTRQQLDHVATLERRVTTTEKRLATKPDGFDQAFAEWKATLQNQPLWQPLAKTAFTSEHGLTLTQNDDLTLTTSGETPAKDTWQLTLNLPEGQPVTAIRLDTVPKKTGGKWKDKNVVLSEFKAELIETNKSPKPLKLTNPRADFSQKNWPVAKAIDGKPDTGWAFSPKAADPHAAVFDFAEAIPAGSSRQLRLTLVQTYGIGLVFENLRVSTSSHPTTWLHPDIDPTTGLEATFIAQAYPETRKLTAELASLRNSLATGRKRFPTTPVLRELPPDRHRQTHIHRRGNFLDPGEPVTARVPTHFGAIPENAPKNRLGVARWIVSTKNPLTTRVAVNRIWARLFGTGIVETEEDFGTQGTLPSHPALLDWLAVDFGDNGWSLKHLLRTITLSSTYRQSSASTPAQLAADPQNRLLGRGARFRLSAETIRDQALAASGLLTHQVGGPPVMPPQPPGIWKTTYSGEKWVNAEGPDRYRRGLYTFLKRTSPHPTMTTFDAGSGEVCQIRRLRTNTPLQALITLNDPAFVEAAGALSQRMQDLAHGFRLVLTRPPDPTELARLEQLYHSLKSDFDADPEAGKKLLRSARLDDGDPALVAVASVILNLDETLTKP